MKIAIASLGKDENSKISDQAGRAPYFLIFDEEGNISQVIENVYAEEMRSAGADATELLVEKNIDMLVAGDIGPRMARILENEGVECKIMSGLVKEAIEKIRQ
jgi:predicted Fe-Mo cluster-binding NifX family protein